MIVAPHPKKRIGRRILAENRLAKSVQIGLPIAKVMTIRSGAIPISVGRPTEQHETNVPIGARKTKIRLSPKESGITDIASIDISHHVDYHQRRYNMQVDFPLGPSQSLFVSEKRLTLSLDNLGPVNSWTRSRYS